MKPTRQRVAEYLFRMIQRKGIHPHLADEEMLVEWLSQSVYDRLAEWEHHWFG